MPFSEVFPPTRHPYDSALQKHLDETFYLPSSFLWSLGNQAFFTVLDPLGWWLVGFLLCEVHHTSRRWAHDSRHSTCSPSQQTLVNQTPWKTDSNFPNTFLDFFFPGTENRFNCCCCLYADNQNQHALIFIAATVLYGRQILANTQRSNCKDGSLIANLQGNLKLGGGVSTVNWVICAWDVSFCCCFYSKHRLAVNLNRV